MYLTRLPFIAALIFLAAVVLTVFPMSLQRVKVWMHKDSTILVNQIVDPQTNNFIENMEAVSCNKVNVTKVWTQSFSKLASESPLRKADLNGDGVEDIVFGYGIDFEQYEEAQMADKKTVCYSSKGGHPVNCEGGILALNGVTGLVIWQRWTAFNVFSMFCNVDLNGDQKNDCVASGRGGLIIAVNGETGNLMWTLRESPEDIPDNQLIIDLYTINPIRDLDGDNVVDVMAVHVEENEATRTGHIRLISGATGKIIKSLPTPFNEEVFVPLQLITNADGTEQLLILTGGQNTPGGVYLTDLLSIMKKDKSTDYRTVYRNKNSGFMAPAILTDVNMDGVPDIILSSFNSTVYAFNGKTYSSLWNFTFPSSESVTSIVPGHFDRDNVTDFMVKYSTGPGFPIYYYSQTIVLSGLNGSSLMNEAIVDSGGPNNLLGGMSISQTIPKVGDYYLHWQTECNNKEKPTDAYQFIPESSIVEQSRADTCMLRYNQRTVLKLYGLTRHLKPPGFLLFSSDDMALNFTSPIQVMGTNAGNKKKMVVKHPKMQKKVTSTNEEVQQGNFIDPRQPMGNEIKRIDLEEKPQRISTTRTRPVKHPQQQSHAQGHGYANLNPFDNEAGNQPKQQQQPLNNMMLTKNKPYPYNFANQRSNSQGFQGFSENNANMMRKQQNGFNGFDNSESPDYAENLNNYYADEVLPILNNYALASQYPTNRDVRSKNEETAMTLQDMLNLSEEHNGTDGIHSGVHDDTQTVKKVLNEEVIKPYVIGHSETLWDIEMEKEAAEAMKDDYPYRQRRDINAKSLPIAAVSSTGVLLRPLRGSKSIDYVFALNVRESEPFPPLLLPEDLACVEEKIKTYQSKCEFYSILIRNVI